MSENLVKMCRRLSRYAHAQLSGIDLERIANRIERLEAELITAEQRGYANAMEAERKLHEERIEELEAKLAKAVEALDRIQDGSYGKLAAKARTILAELKGEDRG
jgi:predicted DNA-binding protein